MLQGLKEHCPDYPIAIFEDCGQRDGTAQFLSKGEGVVADEFLATVYRFAPNITAFVGQQNLGVSGNSNRAIRWFMEHTAADHLCLCNDDLHVQGDFPAFYRQAHRDLGCGFFCFNDFWEWPTHRWIIARCRGYRVKVFPRMTAIMVSTLRRAVNEVGYFDTRFGKFGEEHCDWNNRMRQAKLIQLDGLDQPCLDVEPANADGTAGPALLRHQEVESSMTGQEREMEDKLSVLKMQEAAARYVTDHYYRPFSLLAQTYIGGTASAGIRQADVPKYKTLVSS